MGAGDSKLSFKKGVFRLAEEHVRQSLTADTLVLPRQYQASKQTDLFLLLAEYTAS